jgi:hypothetical protein
MYSASIWKLPPRISLRPAWISVKGAARREVPSAGRIGSRAEAGELEMAVALGYYALAGEQRDALLIIIAALQKLAPPYR